MLTSTGRHFDPARTQGFGFIVLSPPGSDDASVPIAGSRAGALGVQDLQFAAEPPDLARLAERGRGRCGVLLDGPEHLEPVLAARRDRLAAILLTDRRADRLAGSLELVQAAGLAAYAVVTGLDEALAAEAVGADAVIAKGHEAAGWIGDEGSFVLLQRILSAVTVPVWAWGGIGLHTVAAAWAAGAAGAVLDGQLLLARESSLPDALRAQIDSTDGSETAVLGSDLGAPFRVYSRPGLAPVEDLRQRAAALSDRDAWHAAVREGVARNGVLPLGQDAAFAADLARRFGTVGGIVGALRRAVADASASVRRRNPLAEDGALAQSHGTRFPIVQGPMTRVSDRAEFAAAVAEAGALPFLALALMRERDVDALLARTRELVGDRSWGVGILGFVPPELRAEQLAIVRAHRPPFALVAGGRPDQARELEEDGITTYLHVPSPGLLRLYLAEGARRFVFEGRECGGHVGPRTSFVLWDTALRVLLEELPRAASDCHVLFAGGIHDARSAAMVAAAAATASDRGIRVGVLLGTAYLFTREATELGAITSTFQDAAIAGRETALLESGPGHATRCLASPFVEHFNDERQRLRAAGLPADELREHLERLNIGRLRIAAKGVDRHPAHGRDPEAPKLLAVDPPEQWNRGMFMIGQVAALRDRVTSLADLHGDVSAGSSALLERLRGPEAPEAPPPAPADVAIVGIGCILPGAPDVGTFWANILDKVDAIGEVPLDRWDWRRYYDPDPAAKDKIYSRWGGFIDDVPFDPVAFGLPPRSLASIEPFQLLALLTAKAALADAGYERRPFARERTSVIFGAGGGGADLAVGYTVRSALPSLVGDAGPELYERLPEWTEDSFAGLLMNVAAGRIANRLDLGGANYTVDAACASSLAAVGLAVRELQAGTSDMVLAGGVDAIQNPFAYLCFSKTHALSPNGRCRPFDADADGIAISEGFAAVVLKRVADAERDGDRIYAVIRGVGAASDGRDRSLTAPRPEGQIRALRRAYAQARISAATVELVEAHGTGTVAGDGAEVQALSALFSESGAGRQRCAIGSVKSMIGHTKATAGVAGLVKAALALHHRILPPSIGVTRPNPKANFAESPFYVNVEARPWVRSGGPYPRRAGVSAFGFGGTDFHVVLEEYDDAVVPADDAAVDRWPAELLLWRGTRQQIRAAVDALAARVEAGAAPALVDLARTLAAEAGARGGDGAALALAVESADDLRSKLVSARELLASDTVRAHTPSGLHWAERPATAGGGRVAFLFPGQGSQAVDMCRSVALAFPEARAAFERADRVLADRYEAPLSRYVFPPPRFDPEEERRRQAELTDTHVAQAALGATELAYLRVLRALGVEPDMVAGHSYGELVALAAAGSLGEDDLLWLSESRGRFMREAAAGESGAMAAVEAAPAALGELLAGDLVAANLNAPEQTVISGPREDIEAAVEWCRERGIRARALPVACAFHSPLVAAARHRFAESVEDTAIRSPRVPVYANTTAEPHADDPAAIAELLCEHLVRPVEFVREVEAMYRDGARVFVEVGPRSVLTGLVSRILDGRDHVAVAVDQPGRAGLAQLVHCLAALAAEGVTPDAERLFRGRSAGSETRSHPPGTWLVNGGRVRPADAPPSPAPSPSTPSQELPAVTISSNGGADGTGDVMGRYQQVMQHFLETQRTVMLAYLGAPSLPPPRVRPAAPMVEATPALAAIEPAPKPPPPAPAAVEAPPPAAGNGHALLTADQIKDRLLAIVSERTGYPAEMLDLDADLEGDLGIDSIKRVEIAGTFTQTAALPDGAAVDIEQVTASRTLREVIAALQGAAASGAESARPFEHEPAEEERIGRFVLHTVDAPTAPATAGLAADGAVVVVEDDAGVSQALADALAARGEPVVRLAAAALPQDTEAATRLRDELGPAKALLHLAALGGSEMRLAPLLLLLQALRPDLEAAAAAGGAAVLAATRVDEAPAEHAAVRGFLKTLAHEWPAVRVKAVELAPAPQATTAEQLLTELSAGDDLVEVAYRDGRRTQLTLAPASLDDRPANVPVDGDCVVLVTGGARGITAEIAVQIARRHRPTLVLVGRTPPGEEDPATAGIDDPRELRRAIVEARRRAGSQVATAAVEEDCRRLLRRRELRENLARLRETGARVEYLTCDVRDAAAFAALVDGVYERHGRIDGVIHGAGVIEDRLIRDKSAESLERVLATKAGAARTLADRLRPEGLRFLVLFSSISGRFGNRGQGDYAAACEVLAALARELDRRWPARVVAIDWGPWRTTGMVSPEVEEQFRRRGVALIEREVGCRLMERELARGRKGEAEVVIAGVTAAVRPLLAGTPARHRAGNELEIVRTLDLRHDRYLDDHRVDGRPVLPFAAAMGLMAEAAAATRPQLEVAGLRDIRVLHGVTVDERTGTAVRITAAPEQADGDVAVAIAAADGGRRHYSAVVELAGATPAAAAGPAPLDDLPPYPLDLDETYRDLLFHGPLFQGIAAIEGMDERGARALLRPSAPSRCVAGADGLEWLLDPILLDCALQMQVVWARRHWDVTLLPSQIGACRRGAVSATRWPVRHELRIRPGIRPPLCHADHWLYRSDGVLLATLADVVGVGTQALNRLPAGSA
jgi:acyl transferase domain-containing protein/NAD(P)H-dependent flavin oxidoreductase YrpB (nitropropane dioxygenase family)/NAD(P)-dependent dehydrogenase (short-subunit alcohol dehydrogenase family)